MTTLRSCVCVVASCLLAFLLAGCDGAEETLDLGDWTLNTEGMTLREDLRVSETENYFLGPISDLDVTTEGRMVVLDADASHLKILHPDGTLLDTLGREGRGLGEQQVVTTTLPSDMRLHKVTNNRAYGQTTTENGAPALVRYRIRIDN